jgi:uncharacterized protein
MRGANVVVIALVRNKIVWAIAGFIIFLILFVLFFTKPLSAPSGDTNSQMETISMRHNGGNILAEVVRTDQAKARGLGGRNAIGQPGAMLFVYSQPEKACFWMKDMNFAIDMIWIGADKKIIHIEENVSPRTFPESFCPDSPAQFVLELPAGKSRQLGLGPGEQLQF